MITMQWLSRVVFFVFFFFLGGGGGGGQPSSYWKRKISTKRLCYYNDRNKGKSLCRTGASLLFLPCDIAGISDVAVFN